MNTLITMYVKRFCKFNQISAHFVAILTEVREREKPSVDKTKIPVIVIIIGVWCGFSNH